MKLGLRRLLEDWVASTGVDGRDGKGGGRSGDALVPPSAGDVDMGKSMESLGATGGECTGGVMWGACVVESDGEGLDGAG